jgi:hypothetical protein
MRWPLRPANGWKPSPHIIPPIRFYQGSGQEFFESTQSPNQPNHKDQGQMIPFFPLTKPHLAVAKHGLLSREELFELPLRYSKSR